MLDPETLANRAARAAALAAKFGKTKNRAQLVEENWLISMFIGFAVGLYSYYLLTTGVSGVEHTVPPSITGVFIGCLSVYYFDFVIMLGLLSGILKLTGFLN